MSEYEIFHKKKKFKIEQNHRGGKYKTKYKGKIF